MSERRQEENQASVLKGLALGAVAGVGAGFVMNQFQSRVLPKVKDAIKEDQPRQQSGRSGGQEQGKSEPATVKAAQKVARVVVGRDLTKDEKKVAGPAAHYAMAGVTGAIYGAMAEKAPVVTSGAGSLYGTGVWAMADEVVVPATGLSKPPTEHPPSTHLEALAGHVVYGVSLELFRRGLNRVF